MLSKASRGRLPENWPDEIWEWDKTLFSWMCLTQDSSLGRDRVMMSLDTPSTAMSVCS